jgi:hypothetical protein
LNPGPPNSKTGVLTIIKLVYHLGDLGVDKRIILKLILRNGVGYVLDSTDRRQCPMVRLREHSDEPLGSIRRGNILAD